MNFVNNNFSSIRPFTIVSAPYTDFQGGLKRFSNGDVQRGLFMVARADVDGNILAFKLTSQVSRFLNQYTFTLSAETHPFLKTDSYIQCDKIHTLMESNCITLGEVAPFLRPALFKKITFIFNAICTDLDRHVSTRTFNYRSPNVIARANRPMVSTYHSTDYDNKNISRYQKEVFYEKQ